ncbi:MAG: YqgE/AlgH family protein [Flavobacteriales bacterium]
MSKPFQQKATVQPEKGRVLLAEPHLNEDFFKRAVILLIDHCREESFGLVLNNPADFLLSDLFEHIELELQIFKGGPVSPNQLFYLHRFVGIEGALEVSPGLYFGGDWKTILLQAHLVANPKYHLRLFAGYSGWGAGQLEAELQEGSWICVCDPNIKALFQTSPKELWKKSMLQQGPELAAFAHYPVNISDN